MTLLPAGRPAPDFSLPSHHGEPVTLSTLRGRPVVVVFFPAAFTGVCTSEMGALRDGMAGFDAAGARLLAISTDPMFALRVFAEQERLPFTLLSDFWPHGRVARTYGVLDDELGTAQRASYVLDADGVITWTVVNAIGAARDMADHVRAVTP